MDKKQVLKNFLRGGKFKLLTPGVLLVFLIFISILFIGCGTVAKTTSKSNKSAVKKSLVPENFVLLSGGTFQMGTALPFVVGNPIHNVTLTKPFALSKYQTTQKEFQAVMGYNKSNFTGSDLPVNEVSWYEAVQYCLQKTLQAPDVPDSVKDHIIQYIMTTNFADAPLQDFGEYSFGDISEYVGDEDFNNCQAYLLYAMNTPGCYRLPTEAEWEYALRGGTTSDYIWGDDHDKDTADAYGWNSNNNTTEGYLSGTKPVGKKLANEFGLYDMLGNVWEWCVDTYKILSAEDSIDPICWDEDPYYGDTSCMLRGGSWAYGSEDNFLSTYRDSNPPAHRFERSGFRVARTVL